MNALVSWFFDYTDVSLYVFDYLQLILIKLMPPGCIVFLNGVVRIPSNWQFLAAFAC